jgi:hypothetical protein
MPGQTTPWKIGVWPLALATLLHALPWWVMLQRSGGGDGPTERSMQFREIRLTPPAPLRDLADAVLAAAPEAEALQPLAPQAASPAPATPAPVEPAYVPLEATDPPSPLTSTESSPEAATADDAQAPGNGMPPGWIFDPESYVPAEELDQPPQLVGEWVINEAAVPVEVKDRPRRIRVEVRMWVSAEGHMDIIQFLDADPVVPWLDVLLKDLDKSTLKPAMRDGQPVASSWRVEMNIDLVNAF